MYKFNYVFIIFTFDNKIHTSLVIYNDTYLIPLLSPVPDIDPGVKGALGAGELAAVFADRPEVREFLSDFVSTQVQCAQGASAAGRISPNTSVGSDCYSNEILATQAQAVVAALATEGFRFDASDLMPSEVGSGQFWTGMNEYMRGGPDTLDGVLEDIDNAWP